MGGGGSTNLIKSWFGGGYNKWRGGGRRKNRRKKSKFGQKLHEIKRTMADFGKSKNIFLKSLVWGGGGGYNKLKSLEKKLENRK